MKQLLFALLVAVLFIAPGCKKVFPDGPAVKEERVVADFTKIEAAFSGDVEFIQSASKGVQVEAAQNIQHYIITEVKGNTLILKTKPNVNIRGGSVTVYVSNPGLAGATLSGSGNISVKSEITGDDMDLRISGRGNIYLPKLAATSLNAQITGSGNIEINGGATNAQDITITGNGNYRAQPMRSEHAKVKVTGSGEARVWAENSLNIQISGSGDVWYAGNPAINTSISGSGKVRKL